MTRSALRRGARCGASRGPAGVGAVARLVWALGVLLLPGIVEALPILSVDVDPAQPGIQSTREVEVGELLALDVVIEGVDPALALNAFELDLVFDFGLLVPEAAQAGSFLRTPIFELEKRLAAPAVGLAYVTLGSDAAEGAGVLARLEARALAGGLVDVGLENVILSAPFGVLVPFGSLAGASVSVVAEPQALVLVSVGLLGLWVAGRPRGRLGSQGPQTRQQGNGMRSVEGAGS